MRTTMRRMHDQTGMTIVVVLIMILLMTAIGAIIMLGADRNSEMRGTYQKTVAGFQAAEGGINLGAAAVLDKMQANALPNGSDCSPQTTTINARTVTYTLSGCGQSPAWTPLPADDPFAGLMANVYTYTLTSTAVNSAGFTESNLKMQFFAREIPMFQFGAFFSGDLEYSPTPPTVFNGRMHTNGDMYLNSWDCGTAPTGGLELLGQITIVGSGLPGTTPLTRGRKDQTTTQNANHVYISLDGTNNVSSMQVLGVSSQGDTSCGPANDRQVPQSEINSWNGRIRVGIKNITLPNVPDINCAPWSCPSGVIPPATGYWQGADLRIVLDLTATPAHLAGSFGPALPPVNVVDASGSVIPAATAALHTLMQNVPGVITYNDIPTGAQWDCSAHLGTCESNTYNAGANGYKGYTPNFPSPTSTCPVALTGPRQPRTTITANNYCDDYRYGGFYDWRQRKPIVMLNVDWMALEEWNRNNANAIFNSGSTTNNGLVVFLSVRGPNSQGANDYGVRIYDAARARRNTSDLGATFVSDGGMYVLGNFNCPQPNTSGGPAVPATCGGSGYQKPASLVADSINVLSCGMIQAGACANINMNADQWPAWPTGNNNPYRPFDENTTTGPYNGNPGGNGGVQAAQTFVYGAFLSGNDKTWCATNHAGFNCGSTDAYGGGLENYPRFHEDWKTTPTDFWYLGSFVAINTPIHSCYSYIVQFTPTADDAAFPCGGTANLHGFWRNARYYPPVRHYFYDTSFNTAANLPPLTPHVVSLKQVLFTQPLQ